MNITINADIISIVSAAIAFLAMMISINQAHISKRSLKFQEKNYLEGLPDFRIKDILDSYSCFNDEGETLRLLIFPLITNLSDKPTALEKIQLHVQGERSTIVLSPKIDDQFMYDGYNLAPKSSEPKWICFEIPKDTYDRINVIKHILLVEDICGKTDKKAIVWIKEMVVENEEKQI